MAQPFYGKTRKPRVPYEANDAFDVLKVFVPKGTLKIIREKSDDLRVRMSRLVAIAIDNELDASHPFTYNCDMPTSPYVEYAYVDEASKLMEFLKKFPTGTSIDSIMLCRRDFGVPDRRMLMFAYRELLEKNLIEEFVPKSTRFTVKEDYKRVRVVGLTAEEIHKTKFKRVEGESIKFQRPILDKDIDRTKDEE